MRIGLVRRFSTLIVCGVVTVVVLMMRDARFILASLRDKEKADFEFRLLMASEIKKKSL